jgi:hypothetical protein
VHLDAGDALAQRRRLEIEQTEAGDADQDRLACEQLGRDVAREHVGGRNEAFGNVGAEVDVERAVRLQRDPEVSQGQLDALAAAVLDAQRRRGRRDPQHL